MSEADTHVQPEPPRPGTARLWTGILGGPTLLVSVIGTNFALVPAACGSGWLPLPHLLSGSALAAALGCAGLAWGGWRRSGRSWPGDQGGTAARSRFMAALGVLVSAFSAFALTAVWSITFLVNPCQ
jgi:hypothetical protein